MAYQHRSIYEQYADYMPRGPTESRKVREYAERQYKALIEQGLWEDKASCYSFLQQINQEVIGVPSAQEKRKRQQEASAQRPQTVIISDPSTHYNIYQQPQGTQSSLAYPAFGSNPPLAKPVPYAVTSEMRMPSNDALDKIKSLRASLQQQLHAPSVTIQTPSTSSSLELPYSSERNEPAPSRAQPSKHHYVPAHSNPYIEKDTMRKASPSRDRGRNSHHEERHVTFEPTVTSSSDSLENMIAYMKAEEAEASKRNPILSLPNDSKPAVKTETKIMPEPIRATSPVVPVAVPSTNLRESIESIESVQESEVSIEDEEESEEESKPEQDEHTNDQTNDSIVELPKESEVVPSQAVSSPNHNQASFSFISNTTLAPTPSPSKEPTGFTSEQKKTPLSPMSSSKLEELNDSLRISKESQLSKSSTSSVSPRKTVAPRQPITEYETSDEEEINLSGSFQSFRDQKEASRSKQTSASPNKYIPDIHIHNHNHFPPTMLPQAAYQPLPAYQQTTVDPLARPKLTYDRVDENIQNQAGLYSYPNIAASYSDNTPTIRDNRKVVMNSLDTLRDSIDLSALSLQKIREITGHY